MAEGARRRWHASSCRDTVGGAGPPVSLPRAPWCVERPIRVAFWNGPCRFSEIASVILQALLTPKQNRCYSLSRTVEGRPYGTDETREVISNGGR